MNEGANRRYCPGASLFHGRGGSDPETCFSGPGAGRPSESGASWEARPLPRRAVSLAILLLLIGAVSAAPAQAKCCPLEKLVISGPGFQDFTILREQLDDQLSEVEQGNLYWPVLNGSFKGNNRPEGGLGPPYESPTSSLVSKTENGSGSARSSTSRPIRPLPLHRRDRPTSSTQVMCARSRGDGDPSRRVLRTR